MGKEVFFGSLVFFLIGEPVFSPVALVLNHVFQVLILCAHDLLLVAQVLLLGTPGVLLGVLVLGAPCFFLGAPVLLLFVPGVLLGA